METWKDFELAAVERFWDGYALAAHHAPDSTGAAYMLGYAGEMTLKAAYFRSRGTPATTDIWPLRKQLVGAANAHSPGKYVLPSAYHDLHALCDALVWERASLGRPLGVAEAALRSAVGALMSWWSVSLRYRPGALSEKAIADCWIGADWLVSNYHLLY